ncbi:DUF6894 family protein [Lichenibacterium ramalinae]|uniref:DUF6894 family protein n=1 Tax=Lichenibacterium ramalinae TaxID=2316527 RepID=UPI003D171BB5
MPLYYFDVRNADGLHRDEVGDHFDSLDEAIDIAQSLLPDLASRKLSDGDWHDLSCDVRDDAGRVVYQVELTYRGTRMPVRPASRPAW